MLSIMLIPCNIISYTMTYDINAANHNKQKYFSIFAKVTWYSDRYQAGFRATIRLIYLFKKSFYFMSISFDFDSSYYEYQSCNHIYYWQLLTSSNSPHFFIILHLPEISSDISLIGCTSVLHLSTVIKFQLFY